MILKKIFKKDCTKFVHIKVNIFQTDVERRCQCRVIKWVISNYVLERSVESLKLVIKDLKINTKLLPHCADDIKILG